MSVKNKNAIGKIMQKNIKCENALSKNATNEIDKFKRLNAKLKTQNIECFKYNKLLR